MKKHLLLFVLLSASLFIKAQDSSKVKELGITTRSLDSFGITYRFGTKTALWRLSIPTILGANNETTRDTTKNTNSNIDIDISIGREWRKPITEKAELRLGSSLGFSYSKRYSENLTSSYNTTTYAPYLMLILGMNYHINDNFIIGAEIQPGVGYLISKQEVTNNDSSENYDIKNKGINYAIRNSALISFIYQF